VFKAYFKEYIHYISDLNFFKNSRQCGITKELGDSNSRIICVMCLMLRDRCYVIVYD